jgi:hypothetical protein
MPTVRIGSDWKHPGKMEWIGAPNINKKGRIKRAMKIPKAAYQGIEAAIAKGHIEGSVYLEDGSRFQWFLDR